MAILAAGLIAALGGQSARAATPIGDPAFGAATQTSRIQGFLGAGAPAAPVSCPADAVLTDLTAIQETDVAPNWLTGVTANCGLLHGDTAAGATVDAAVPAGTITGFRTDVQPVDGSCPAGSLATGLTGRSGGLIDGLQLICRPLQSDGTLGTAAPGTYAGGTGGAAAAELDCPDGSVATGLVGNVGQDLNSVGLVCRPLSFVGAQPTNSAWPNAQLVSGDSATDAGLTTTGQELWYKFPVVPGSRVTVSLTGLDADYDLTLFKDISQAFTSLTSTQDLTHLSAEFAADAFSPSAFSPSAFSPSAFSPSAFSPSAFSPSAFSPSAFSPSAFSPSAFSPSAFSPSAFSPSAFSPSAFSPSAFSPSAFSPAVSVPSAFSPSAFSPSAFSPATLSSAFSSAQTRSLIAISAHDGTAPESISAATWNNTGDFYIRVQGRNGAIAPGQFHLTVATTGGPCSGLTLADHAADPTIVGSGSPQTVILTDPTRMTGTAADKAALASTLSTFAGAVQGVVVNVSTSPKVAALEAQADGAAVSCPYAENLVAQAIRDIVNSYRTASSTPKYVVIVGNDHAIPFFRYADASGLGPESNYIPPVADDTASQASLRTDNVLGQDAYGAATDVSIKGVSIPVPDLAVGRVVETPTEITATLQQYLARNGAPIVPSSTLVTGYDFLASSANSVESDLAAGTPSGTHDTLITNQGVPATTTTVGGVPSPTTSWTATDLAKQLFGARHDIVYLAGHFSANSALAADYQTSVLTTDLAAAPASRFANTLVFSAGCHSGYNIVDTDGIPQVTVGLDWAQAFAQKGATLIAGTGYQYGDTDFVKYSAKLYADFAHELRYGQGAVAVGAALVQAKQQYLTDTPTLEGIDQKTLLESTLYGLPMTGVNLPGGRISQPSDPSLVSPGPVTDPAGTSPGTQLGLQSADLDVTPTLTPVTKTLSNTAGGSITATYLNGPDGTDSGPDTPTLPLVNANVTGASGTVLRGVGFRSGTYTDTDGITPLTGAATTEVSAAHGPFVSSAFYPNNIARPNYFDALGATGSGGTTRLLLTPAQYMSDAPGSLTDTQRAYSELGLQLFYSGNRQTYGANTPALAAAPTISGVSATIAPDGRSVDLQAQVVGDPSAGIQNVWVTYTGAAGSPLHGAWSSIDLVQDPTYTTLWTATLALPDGQQAADVRYLVQAVNGVGLVGADDNQGSYYTPGITPGSTVVSGSGAVPLTGTTLTLSSGATSGAYGSSVPVSATLVDAGGSPVAGRTVSFDLGGSSITAVTGADGVATGALPLTPTPGSFVLTASFDGDATFATAGATPLSFRVVPAPTLLSIKAGSGGGNGVTATLTAADATPMPQKTVAIVATRPSDGVVVATIVRITNQAGTITVPAASLPSTDVTLTAVFGSATTALPGGSTADLSDPVAAASASTSLRTASIVGTPPTSAPLNATLAVPITTTGTAPVTVSATGLPPGVVLTHTATGYSLTGAPTKLGSYPITLTADNGIAVPATVSSTLVVGYRFVGLLPPVNDPPGTAMSVFSVKSIVPVRFRLTDGNGVALSLRDAAALVLGCKTTVTVTPLGTTTNATNEAVIKGPAMPGRCALYDPVGKQFFFLAGTGFQAGHTYTISVSVAGSPGVVLAQHSVVVGIGR